MTILIILLAVLAGFAAFVATRPDQFHYSRSMVIAASPDKVFPHVNQPRQWNEWSPWAKLDPEAKATFEGPESGVGSIMRWVSKKTGEGSMTNIESRPNDFIKFKLDFLKPMTATHTAEFTFASEGSGTRVTWSMYGRNNFMGKAMTILMNCGKMMNSQFDKGLTGLKDIVEAQR